MLKTLENIGKPDELFATVIVHEADTGMVRPMTVADHHAAVAAIQLVPTVPDAVRVVFDRARNAFLFSWFVYDLTPLAESQGYAALEMALRKRRGEQTAERIPRGLAEQLQTAFRDGYFDDYPVPASDESTDHAAYFEQVTTLVRHFRNHLAHGSEYVNMPGATLDALRLCCDLINHLYK